MKINRNNSKEIKNEFDLDLYIKELMVEHEFIFFEEIGDYTFIYRPLNRKEYKKIYLNDSLNQIEKEDAIVEATLLYPLDIDFDEIEAGIPSMLYEKILNNSFLRADQILNLLVNFREELNEMDSQMTCIIAEAFPNYKIEEIESWDMIKFCKMFAKAEYNLTNFRNLQLQNDLADILRENLENNDIEDEYEEIEDDSVIEEVKPKIEETSQPKKYSDGSRVVKVGSREMTQEEYNEYLKIRKAFPDIDWDNDAMFTGYDTMTVDTTPVALRDRHNR